MYAIIEDRGKQYRVEEGQTIRVDSRSEDKGTEIDFDKVMLVKDEEKADIGAPYVKGASVKGRIQAHKKGDKIIVYKYKRRKGYKRKQGHRQPFTEIEILSISK